MPSNVRESCASVKVSVEIRTRVFSRVTLVVFVARTADEERTQSLQKAGSSVKENINNKVTFFKSQQSVQLDPLHETIKIELEVTCLTLNFKEIYADTKFRGVGRGGG